MAAATVATAPPAAPTSKRSSPSGSRGLEPELFRRLTGKIVRIHLSTFLTITSQEDTNAAWNSKQEVLVVKKGGLLEGRLDEEVDHKKQVQVRFHATDVNQELSPNKETSVFQVDLENERTLDRSNDLWSSLEESGWIGIEVAS